MAGIETKFQQSPPPKNQRSFIGAQVFLRILAVSTTLAAAWVMITAKQSKEILGIALDAQYSYSSAFKFFAIANVVACALSLVSLFLMIILSRQLPNPDHYYYFFLHDLVMMSLVLAGCGAATAIGLVGKYGNEHTGWSPICDHFGKFCHKVTTSLVLSYLSVFFLLTLTIVSASNSRQIPV